MNQARLQTLFPPKPPHSPLSQSAEIELPRHPVSEPDRADEVVTLGPDDFQRIGIQPKETRLEVIRRAASRAARSLARKQLNTPNPITEEQLSRIAVSTYRLLDPRQREDCRSRAHVGRIRPGALYRAGRTEFANERILIQSCNADRSSVSTHHLREKRDKPSVAAKHDAGLNKISTGIQNVRVGGPLNEINAGNRVANADESIAVVPEFDLALIYPTFKSPPSRLARLRRRATGPGIIVVMISLLLLTAMALWIWRQNL